jgi:O-antigen/teichoic acid export membrane protein
MIPPTPAIDLRRKLFANSALMLVCRVVTIIVSLISVPIVVSKLGLDGYGTWEVILAISALSTVFQGTVSGTLLWRMSAAYGTSDPAEARRLVRLGTAASVCLFVLVVPPVWALRGSLVQVLNIPPPYASSAAWVLSGIVAVVTLGGIHETLCTVLVGYQRAGVASMIQSGQLVLFNVVAILGLLMGLELWSMLLAYVSGFLFSLVASYFCASATCGQISLLPALPTRHDLRTISGYAGMLLVGQVSAILRDQTDKVVLAAFASPTWVGLYGIAVRLASLVLMISTLFYAPLSAAAGAMNAAGDWNGVRRLYSNIITILAVCGGATAVLVGGLYDRIIVLWMGHGIPGVGPILLVLLFGNTAAMVLTGAGTSLCRGVGRVGIDTGYTTFGLVSNLLLKVVLIAAMGAMGSVISSSASWAMASLLFVFLLHRYLDLPREATRRALLSLVLATLVVILGRVISAYASPVTGRLAALGSVAGLGTILLSVYLMLMVVCGGISWQSLQQYGKRAHARWLGSATSELKRES